MKRQPQGIPVGGQFAADRKAEPAGSLSGLASPEESAAPAERDAGHVLSKMNSKDRLMEEQALGHCTPGGRELYLQKLEIQQDRGGKYGLSDISCNHLAELGFTDTQALLDGPMDPTTVAFQGMSKERYDFLAATGGDAWHRKANGQNWHTPNGDSWSNTALLEGDEDDLRRVFNGNHAPGSRKGYAALVTVGHPEREDRLELASMLDITSPAYIETDHDLNDISGIMSEVPPSTARAPHVMLRLAEAGHTKQSIKKYGVAAAETYNAADLEASGVPAKSVRSFISRGRLRNLAEMKAFHNAGFTKGDDVARALLIFGESAAPKDMAESIEKVPLDDLAKWQREQFRRRSGAMIAFTSADVDMIVQMRDLGVTPHNLG